MFNILLQAVGSEALKEKHFFCCYGNSLCLLTKPWSKTVLVRYELPVLVLPSYALLSVCVFCWDTPDLLTEEMWQTDRQSKDERRGYGFVICILLKVALSSFSIVFLHLSVWRCLSCLLFMIHWLEMQHRQVRGCWPVKLSLILLYTHATPTHTYPHKQTHTIMYMQTQKHTWLWLTSPLTILQSFLSQSWILHWDPFPTDIPVCGIVHLNAQITIHGGSQLVAGKSQLVGNYSITSACVHVVQLGKACEETWAATTVPLPCTHATTHIMLAIFCKHSQLVRLSGLNHRGILIDSKLCWNLNVGVFQGLVKQWWKWLCVTYTHILVSTLLILTLFVTALGLTCWWSPAASGTIMQINSDLCKSITHSKLLSRFLPHCDTLSAVSCSHSTSGMQAASNDFRLDRIKKTCSSSWFDHRWLGTSVRVFWLGMTWFPLWTTCDYTTKQKQQHSQFTAGTCYSVCHLHKNESKQNVEQHIQMTSSYHFLLTLRLSQAHDVSS